MIGIIGAMEEEVDALKSKMDLIQTKTVLEYRFYEGMLKDKEVVLMQSGIGKVNSALSTTLLLTYYDIDCIINIGSAGGLYPSQNIGDVVISSDVVHHDVDVRAFGHDLGQVPGLPKTFKANQALKEQVESVLKQLDISYHIGLIASGDQFISTKEQVENIQTHFPNAVCAEMEAASIAQVCHQFNVDFIITRSLSDVFGKGDSHIQFDEYLKKASENSAMMCERLVEKL